MTIDDAAARRVTSEHRVGERIVDVPPVLHPVIDLEEAGAQLAVTRAAIRDMLDDRLRAVEQVYATFTGLGKDLQAFFPKVPEVLPPVIDGRLLAPDGAAAAHVRVRALEPDAVGTDQPAAPWPTPTTETDDRGAFRLRLPQRPVPESGLQLRVIGQGGASTTLDIRRSDLVTTDGNLDTLILDRALPPLPRSVVGELTDVVVPTSEEDVLSHPREFAEPPPVFTLGEGECGRSFRSNAGVIDRYGFSMLVRLVAPQLSGRRLATRATSGDRSTRISSNLAPLGAYAENITLEDALAVMEDLGSFELAQRLPIDGPIDVDRFLATVERNPRLVPKAASLGIGYVLKMHQVWIPAGLSLGDLVYSLPLAPGEQQRIAVSDTRETLSVREQEALTASEAQAYREAADSSTAATFRSAFDESASGGSRMKTSTEAGSFGGGLAVGGFFGGIVAGLGLAGGYSDSTTTGSTSSWQKASRDYASSSTQQFHSNLARAASAKRHASRVSVRLATAAEQQAVTTKVITNHNKCHALTMQYWEVLRHFNVSTKVDDVQLVCFVPLELITFLPADQPRALPQGQYTRDGLLQRYGMLLRHADVLRSRLWWHGDHARGLRSLSDLAGDPTMEVATVGGAASDTVNVTLRGTFLPFEEVSVTVVSTTGVRVGPVRLEGAASAAVPDGYTTRAELVGALVERRRTSFEDRKASISLPSSVDRSQVARIEFTRRFSSFSYRLSLPSGLSFTEVLGYLQNTHRLDVHLSPTDLEREVGGPQVEDPKADIGGDDLLVDHLGAGGTARMGQRLPVAARRLPPVLSYAEVLRIEGLLQHVVQNTVEYSKAVWQALTPEERAIMLERFTIGVPSGGIADASQEVPLLDCVANEVLGYFGNCAIMPFFIPADLANELKTTSRDIQEALLKFHRQAFVPPQSSLTLPSRGVLGEAVLGSCNACEKIDLTRFWNWQDSPGDEATDLATLQGLFGGGNDLVGPEGARAPAELSNGSSMVTINQGSTAMSPADLAKALIEGQPASNLPTNLTGLEQLAAQMKVQTETTSESLNKTISEASGLAKKAMDTLPDAIKAKTAADKAAGDKDGKDGKTTNGEEAGSADDGAPPPPTTDGGGAPTP